MALTDPQRQAIIEARLSGVPVRIIRDETGHSNDTIVAVYRDYLADAEPTDAAELAQLRWSMIHRHEEAAYAAREEGKQARESGDRPAHARYLREERDSLRELARLTGTDGPLPVASHNQPGVGRHGNAREQLTEYLQGLCPSPELNITEQREALKARLVGLCEEHNSKHTDGRSLRVEETSTSPEDDREQLAGYVAGLCEQVKAPEQN